MKAKLMSVLAVAMMATALAATADQKCPRGQTSVETTKTTTTCVGGNAKGNGAVISGGINGSRCTTVTEKYPVCKPTKDLRK